MSNKIYIEYYKTDFSQGKRLYDSPLSVKLDRERIGLKEEILGGDFRIHWERNNVVKGLSKGPYNSRSEVIISTIREEYKRQIKGRGE